MKKIVKRHYKKYPKNILHKEIEAIYKTKRSESKEK